LFLNKKGLENKKTLKNVKNVTKIKKTQNVFYIYGLRFAAERRRLQQLSINSCGRRAACTGAQQQMRVASC